MPADPSGKTAVRIALLAFFIAFTGPVPAAEPAKSADPAAQPVVFRTWAKVALDASGQPTSIEPGPDLPAPVREYLAAKIAQWHFSPPARGTTTGSAVTYLRLGACALPDPAGGYRLGVDLKGNGPRYASAPLMLPPVYPTQAMRQGYGAKMVVSYVVEPDGSATFEGIEYTDGKPRGRNVFGRAVRDWVKHMRYEPEYLAGAPVRTRVQVPVEFSIGRPDSSAHLQRVLGSDECREAASTAGGLQPLAVDSPVTVEVRG